MEKGHIEYGEELGRFIARFIGVIIAGIIIYQIKAAGNTQIKNNEQFQCNCIYEKGESNEN